MATHQYRTLTKRIVDRLAVDDKDAVFWDRELPGFGLRVYPSGAKVYVVQARCAGRSKRATVGRHGDVSPDQARRKPLASLPASRPEKSPSRSHRRPTPRWPNLPSATPSSATRRQNACNVLICRSRKPKVGTTKHRAGERGRGAQTQIRGGGWAGKFSLSC